jgi:hypothetical protein
LYKYFKGEFMHILYKTTNTISGKIYIGVHTTDDLNDGYLGSGTLIKRAIKKYGKEYFEREVLSTYDSLGEAFLAESEIVDDKFVSRKDTYNMTLGGGGSGPKELSGVYGKRWKVSEAGCRNKSLAVMGDKNPNYERVWTSEERVRHSEIMSTAAARGPDHVRYGLPWNDEEREKRKQWSKEAYANRPNKVCPHCDAEMKPNLFARYHGDKCKAIK